MLNPYINFLVYVVDLKKEFKWFKSAIHKIQITTGEELTKGILLSYLGSLAYQARERILAMESLLSSKNLLIKYQHLKTLSFCLLQLGWIYLRENELLNR